MTSSPPADPGSRLDLTALEAHVDVADVERYYRRRRIPVSRRWWATAGIVAVYLVGQSVLIAAIIPIARLDDATERLVYSGLLIVTGAYATGMTALIWRNAVRPTRLDRAAEANDLLFTDRDATRSHFVGTVAAHPAFAFVTDVLRPGSRSDPAWTAGTILARPGPTVRRRGILQIPLERETPHIVLENRRSGILSSLGTRYRGRQRLSLEGDFDRTFPLFCPTGYEADALYIFTPDLMALLLDVAPDCEVELVDGHLLVYSRRAWRLWRPARFRGVLSLASTLGAKARRRTGRYVDWRREPGHAIADQGRRLRLRPSLGGVLSTAVPVLVLAAGVWGFVAGA